MNTGLAEDRAVVAEEGETPQRHQKLLLIWIRRWM